MGSFNEEIVPRMVKAMRKELKRQFDARELDWYTESEDYVAVDGNPDLVKLAEAALEAIAP